MLQYHAAFYMPKKPGDMVVVELLDFPGVLSQGFDLADARVMIASALEDMAGDYLEQGRSLPPPDPGATDPEADLIELLPLRVTAGATRAQVAIWFASPAGR
jgi:predicted RNase H-like HicB family nuclease